MDYFDFERDFKKRIAQIRLPAGAALQQPLLYPTTPPLGWTVEFFIRFADGYHIRIWEEYTKIAGLFASRKRAWAYHYGPTGAQQVRDDGTLQKGSCTDPLVFRIDTARIGLHMHFNSQEPHLKQGQVLGFDLASFDSWDFIRAVLKHRQSGKGIDVVLGFKIQ